MTFLLMVIGGCIVTELLFFALRSYWKYTFFRLSLSGILTLAYTFIATAWIAFDFSIFSTLFAFFTVYKVINFMRIAQNRMHAAYLYRSTRTTASWITIGQLSCLAVWLFDFIYRPGTNLWFYGLLTLQAVVAVALLLSTLRTLRKTRMQLVEPIGVHAADLPSVTVAVPARNETDELEEFLHEIIKSDYPKLEILVLDDCSQLKRTPAIIRDFAHAGVRFLQGTLPDEYWTAKNHAYAQLAAQANSSILIFCGVDVRFEPHTVRQLVTTLKKRNKRMLSLLPLRDSRRGIQWSLVQASRYLWELAPPRRFFNRPPVLSSCWLIYRKDLEKYGGFAAVKRSITPESYFARQSIGNSDSYTFVRADTASGATSVKSHASQRSTAIRTRYPSLRRRPEAVAFVTLSELILILSTFVFAALGLFGQLLLPEAIIALVSASILTITYMLIVINTRVNSWYVAIVWPFFVTLVDIAIMHRSMWQYEFFEVIWKDRNVCLPAMHVVASLPKN